MPTTKTKKSPATLAVAGKGKRAAAACPPCKVAKKRCTHNWVAPAAAPAGPAPQPRPRRRRRQDDDEEQEEATEAVIAVSSNDDQPRAKRARRRQPAAAASKTKSSAGRTASAPPPPPTPISSSAVPSSTAGPTPAPLSQGLVPDVPTDSLEGSMALSLHAVMSKELQARLDDLEAQLQINRQCLEDTLSAGAAVRAVVEQWTEAWKKAMDTNQ